MAAIVVVVIGAVVAAVLLVGHGKSADFASRAASVCTGSRLALKALPTSPTSIAAALEIEHEVLAAYSREITQLGALTPPTAIAAAFRAGVADDQALVTGLRSMLARPDFVQLSVTLPGHPELMPAWLKGWLARSQALLADAHLRFAQAGMPACERSLS